MQATSHASIVLYIVVSSLLVNNYIWGNGHVATATTEMKQSGIEVRMAYSYIIQLVGELARIQCFVF